MPETSCDRMFIARNADPKPGSLVGSLYVNAASSVTAYGAIVAEPAPSIYLVEDMRSFSRGRQKLVALKDMIGWEFYDDSDTMHAVAAEYDAMRR